MVGVEGGVSTPGADSCKLKSIRIIRAWVTAENLAWKSREEEKF
jgi:hypothetical protein